MRGRSRFAPYTRVEDLTTTCLTGLPAWPAAASRFMVPMTLISCSALPGAFVESVTKKVCTIVSGLVALTIRETIE